MTIGRRMAKGAAWMISLRFFIRAIGLVSTIILARLLSPEDFGLVAMATVLMGFIVLLSEMNVEAVLVQRDEIDDSYLNGAFGLNLLMSSIQAVLLALLAMPAAQFYGEPRLELIVYVLALAVFVDGLKNIGAVEFSRELRFHREFVMMAAPKIVSFIVTICVAVITRSYWALVAGILTHFIGRSAFSYIMHPYRPKPTRAHWAEIFRFSKWLLIGQGLRYLVERGPDLVLGRIVGAKAVGLFSVAYEIAMLPTTEMVTPINRAIFPGYSRMNVDNGELRESYLEITGLIALLALPAGIGIAASAPVLVPLLLGDQWLAAIPLVNLLGLSGGLMVLMANCGPVFLALGRPQLNTLILAIRAIPIVVAIIVGAQWGGTSGVATAYLAVLAAVTPVQLLITFHVLSASLVSYFRAVYRPILGCIGMYVLLDSFVVPQILSLDINVLFDALIVALIGIFIFIFIDLVLWTAVGRPDGAEIRVMDFIYHRVFKSTLGFS